ncbi:MAG: hypothetical protein K2O16_09645 [Lachnospiraceae bacterium]|nr:hypothetical protein [Lachnospiraceae bacterium]
MVTSYVLWYENGQNPYETKRTAISEFIQRNSAEYIDIDKTDIIKSKAEEIMKTGIKMKDAEGFFWYSRAFQCICCYGI